MDGYLRAKPWGDLALWKRCQCPGCGAAHRFYCPNCRLLVGEPSGAQSFSADPLPLRVEVVLRDDPSKATGVHAAVLAPESVTVRNFPFEEVPFRLD